MRLWWQALKINVVLGRQCPRLSSATRNLAFHWKAGSKGYAGHHKFNVFLHAFVLSLPLSPKVFWQEDSRSLALDLSYMSWKGCLPRPMSTRGKYSSFHYVDRQGPAAPSQLLLDTCPPSSGRYRIIYLTMTLAIAVFVSYLLDKNPLSL